MDSAASTHDHYRQAPRAGAPAATPGDRYGRLFPALPSLSTDQVGLRALGWDAETPLWYYVLREADVLHDGTGLGPAPA